MKGKDVIKKEDLKNSVFKDRVIGKNNYDRVMEDVSNTLKRVMFKFYFHNNIYIYYYIMLIFYILLMIIDFIAGFWIIYIVY